MLTGSALGAFAMFLLYLGALKNPNPTPSLAIENPSVQNPTTVNKAPEIAAETPNDIPKPRFDFYKLLKESEVIVPATEPAENTATAQPPSEYILQVGSFRQAADADKLRAQLIFLNLDARTEAVTVRGENWHRVVVGPFANHSKLAKARSTLVSNRYNALVLKRKRSKS